MILWLACLIVAAIAGTLEEAIRAHAIELAPVRVNLVCAGLVRTDIAPTELNFYCAGIYKDLAPPEPFSIRQLRAGKRASKLVGG
jgi:NAD(P)-dependent dehydrogenase (short-subunit alcohol dehydrogenase family)